MARMTQADVDAYTARTGKAPATPPAPPLTPRQGQGVGQRAGQAAEDALSGWLDILGIAHEREYGWGASLTPARKYRSDIAIPSARLLVEVDGAAHGIHDKRARDLDRQNLGTAYGWRFLRFLPEHARDGTASLFIQRFLQGEK